MSPALFIAAHPDDETLAMSVAIAEHVAAGQDVHVLWMTRGKASAVLSKLNAASATPNSWWGVVHNPGAEGYDPLTPDEFGAVRLAEAITAVTCLSAGLSGTLTTHEGGLEDGQVTMQDAKAAIEALCDLITPEGAPVRLKGHTWRTQLDNHPDHVAVGMAMKQLATEDPVRYGDVRYYILPYYWHDPDLNLVGEVWDTPTNSDIAARAINACRSYGAWAPPARFAVGHHSTFGMFAQVMVGPKCLFHP